MRVIPRGDPDVVEKEDVVLGESQPLSELLLVASAVSSVAAAIDISRFSSRNNQKTFHRYTSNKP